MKNKKIAILSMQRVVNFGSVLQAYSLRQLVREVTGVWADFIDIDESEVLACDKKVEDLKDYEAPAAYPSGVLQKANRWLIARLSAENKRRIRRFMQDRLALDSKAPEACYDWVIVGSDEVFNHAKGVNLQLHGKVKNAVRVISYAAACGSASAEEIAAEDRQTVRDAMGGFSAISVRDAATERYAAALYDGTVEHHLDPVLVGELSQRAHKPVRLKNYLLVYAYGQRIRTTEEIKAIQSFARSRGLKTVAMGGSQFWCDLYIPADPFRMLDYMYYADYVVTDTFHGAIFSVIHKKQFAVIVRRSNQNKLTGLLDDLMLQDRILPEVGCLEQVLTAPIDYAAVEQILEKEKLCTRTYLKDQLTRNRNED